MPGITATIITFNEEARIAEAIASLSCCEEVIVVDCGSTDRTKDIACALGARVIEHGWLGYAGQKNFAAEQAANEWILNIDADERVSIELSAEIIRWKQIDAAKPHSPQRNGCHAWSMPRRAFYLGKWIRHSGWYPDRKVRFYDRRHCRFEGDFVHETVKPKGSVSAFRGDLFHFPYRDFDDHSKRIDRYTELAAEEARSSGRRGSVLKLVVGPVIAFSKTFFLRAGFLDGWRGLAIAYMGARYVFQREFRILR